MKLLLDVGNSRVKWGTLEAGVLRAGGALPRTAPDGQLLREIGAGLPRPRAVWACNVAGEKVAAALDSACRDLWGVNAHFAIAQAEACGLRSGYGEPERLGADRWLAMLGALNTYGRPLCLVSCGTATTVDAVDATGRHLGGYIIPGTLLMAQALMQGTQLRPGAGGGSTELGCSTDACIANGAVSATAALVDRTIQRLRAAHGQSLHCVVTGGAAAAIMSAIEAPLVHDPDLVLAGLALVADGGAGGTGRREKANRSRC